MKRFFLCIIIFLYCIIIGGAEDKKNNYLETFFGTKDYQTDVFNISNLDMYFSYIYAPKSEEIISRGVFYTYEKDSINKHMIIDNEKIFGKKDLLFHGYIEGHVFYGWEIKIIEKSSRIRTVFYTDFGKKATDGPKFLWDSEKKEYYKEKIDTSQW